MTDATAILVTAITALAPTSVAGLAWWNSHKARILAKANLEKTIEIKVQNDGRFTELIEALMTLARKDGFRDGETHKRKEIEGNK